MPYLTGDDVPVTTRCKVIRIPDDLAFLDAINGQLYELTLPENWEKFGAVTVEQVTAAFSEVYDNYTQESCIEVTDFPYPSVVNVAMLSAEKLGGTTLSFTSQNGQWRNSGVEVTPAAQFNFVQFYFYAKAGNYQVDVMSMTFNNFGQVAFSVAGGSLNSTQDYYSAAQVLNVKRTFTLDVPVSGMNLLQAIVTGKNAASSNYRMLISDIFMRRTGP